MSYKMDRRKFFIYTALSSAGLLAVSVPCRCSGREDAGVSTFDIMKEVMKYRKIESLEHVDLYFGGPEVQVNYADRLGIEKLVPSKPVTTYTAATDEFRKSNGHVIKAMQLFPDRKGFAAILHKNQDSQL